MADGKWIGPFSLIFKSGADGEGNRTNWPIFYVVMNQSPKDSAGRVMVSMENRSPTELRGELETLKANLDALAQQAEDLFCAEKSN